VAAAAARELIGTDPRRPGLPGSDELDARWHKLRSTVATKGLPLDVDAAAGLAAAAAAAPAGEGGGTKSVGSSGSGPGGGGPGMVASRLSRTEIRLPDTVNPTVTETTKQGEVCLDLSDDKLQEDLLGKLKMMAIDDGELRTLLKQRNPEHIPYIIEYMQTKPEPVRLAYLCRELGQYHDPAVIDVLLTWLYNEDQRVVLATIQGLQICGGSSAILAICPFLQSPAPMLVEAAKNALAWFGPQKILTALADLPSHAEEYVRESGVFLLSRMRGKPVTDLLIRMLGDKSESIRRKVMLAMTFQRDPVYIPVLREFMKNAGEEDKKMARKAMIFLQGFAPKPAGAAPRA